MSPFTLVIHEIAANGNYTHTIKLDPTEDLQIACEQLDRMLEQVKEYIENVSFTKRYRIRRKYMYVNNNQKELLWGDVKNINYNSLKEFFHCIRYNPDNSNIEQTLTTI